MKELIILALPFALQLGCKHRAQKSQVKINNGIEDRENKYPAVVRIIDISRKNGLISYQTCTATFIKHDIAITAAHCIEDGEIMFEQIKSIDYRVNKKYMEQSIPKYDLAIIKFPANTAPEIAKLSTKSIEDKDPVIMVGFGHSQIFDVSEKNPLGFGAYDGSKRIGFNNYKKNTNDTSEGMISFSGLNNTAMKADGTNASINSGDSGGPLFVEGKGIVGIASRVSAKDNYVEARNSEYCNLHAPDAQVFLAEAKAAGFDIEGDFSNINPLPSPEPEVTPEPNPEETLPPTEPTEPQVPEVSDGNLNISTFEIEGTTGFKLTGIHSEAKKLELYLMDNDSAFETFDITGKTSFETTNTTWDLRGYSKVRAIIRDGQGTAIQEKSISLSN